MNTTTKQVLAEAEDNVQKVQLLMKQVLYNFPGSTQDERTKILDIIGVVLDRNIELVNSFKTTWQSLYEESRERVKKLSDNDIISKIYQCSYWMQNHIDKSYRYKCYCGNILNMFDYEISIYETLCTEYVEYRGLSYRGTECTNYIPQDMFVVI